MQTCVFILVSGFPFVLYFVDARVLKLYFGASHAHVNLTYIGNEFHFLVECPLYHVFVKHYADNRILKFSNNR